MNYPGHIIASGASTDEAQAIANQLVALGYKDAAGLRQFDDKLSACIKLYQSQHSDALGRPLKVDGVVGPLTWSSLFDAAPVTEPPTGLAGAALGKAISQIGVREHPLGSNRGPEVDSYLTAAGAPLGSYWCMAFVFWCFDHAANDLGKSNSFPKTAGCLDAWERVNKHAPGCVITRAQAISKPSLVRPGLVFILDHGGGLGHTGFVRQVVGGALRTVEGNSNNDGSSNGVGVFDLNRRSVMESDLKGFLDFTAT